MSDLLPRVTCPACEREIAVMPAAGYIGKGHLWRHDRPTTRRSLGGVLTSCPMSLHLVDIPKVDTEQLAFDFTPMGTGMLFDIL